MKNNIINKETADHLLKSDQIHNTIDNSYRPNHFSLNTSNKLPVSVHSENSCSNEQTNSSARRSSLSGFSTGLTQQTIKLKITDDLTRFLIPDGTLLFIPIIRLIFIRPQSWSTA